MEPLFAGAGGHERIGRGIARDRAVLHREESVALVHGGPVGGIGKTR